MNRRKARLRRPILRRWTPAEELMLRITYPTTRTDEVAKALHCSVRRVYNKVCALGLKKDPEYFRTHGGRYPPGRRMSPETEFKKGHVPANKGLRRPPGWAPGRMRETQFKPGRPAHEARNYRPIGSTRITSDGVLERKVTDDPSIYPAKRWVSVARLVWEAAHGPVPPRMRVAFRPGCRTTVEDEITLDRLELVSMRQMMQRNTVHNLPKPLAQAVQLRGALVRQINRRSRA